mmetsp:Transcript_16758/g.52540  ORF Transcript_16758/g.52540 Transcript_16758/m.52540 type:complete len:616 (-) Transcript_16758:157-2004(-)
MYSSLGSAFLVLNLAIALYAVIVNGREKGFPSVQSVELAWVGDSKAPFLMSASIFGSQSLASLVLVYCLGNMRELTDWWGERHQNVLLLYACFSSVGVLMYGFKYTSKTLLCVHADGVGEYLFARNLHWIVSTPAQWFVFSQVCTKSTEEEMVPIYIDTVAMHVFGMAMFFVGEIRMQWFCFFTSSYYFVHMFWLVFQLKLHKDMVSVGTRVRCATLVVWILFPIAVALRWLGYLDAWTEQVLVMSFLDIVAKSVTFSSIIVSRVVLTLARINGTVQLVLSSHDLTLAINETWHLLDDDQTNGVIATYFGETSDSAMLLDLCIDQEHQERLIQAARIADGQGLCVNPPKATVVLRGPGGCEMLAECLVSKILHGRRIVGVAVASQVGNSLNNLNKQDDALMEEYNELAPSEISVSSIQSRSVDMQTRLALHNICDVLRLESRMQRMLSMIFLQPTIPCALFAFDPTAGVQPAVVVASQRLQALFFHQSTMPQPLTGIFDSRMVDTIVLALQTEEVVIMHQWRNVRLAPNHLCEVTMVPLTRMPSMSCSASSMDLGILHLTLADSGVSRDKAHAPPGYSTWGHSGSLLVCNGPEAGHHAPPQLVLPYVNAFLESLS